MTSDLEKRIWEHKNKKVEGFSKEYEINKLVCFEEYDSIEDAIYREKQLKKWNRKWKLELFEKDNPIWRDISEDWE